MHSALYKLFMLSNKAALRRTFRGMKTVRGALLVLFTLGLVATMIVPQAIAALTIRSRPNALNFAGMLEPYAPLVLLVMVMFIVFTNAGEKAIYFSPPEVDFLFPAPFTRRELLIYKLIKTVVGLLVMSLLFSIVLMVYFRSWSISFVGLLLVMSMLQLLGMTMAMLGQIVSEASYTRSRRILLSIIMVVLFLGLGQIAARVQSLGIAEVSATLNHSAVLRVLLSPFLVFTHVLFAANWSAALVGWAALALTIDVFLLILVLKLDANYLESAAAISQKVYERIQRARMGGGVGIPPSARSARLRLPQFPRLSGAGPIAWRQMLLAIRTSRHMFIAAFGLAVVFVVFNLSVRSAPNGPGGQVAPLMGIGLTAYLSFIFSMQLPWAFRGDIDHIDFLKTLPIHPLVVVVGELGGGVLLLTLIQVLMLAVFAAVAQAGALSSVIALAFALPFNAILFSLGNLLFLIYPVRLVSGTTFDFQTFGRMMLFFMLQVLLMFPMFGIPAALGGLAYFVCGYSLLAFALTAWLILVLEVAPILVLVSWAFQKFDPSTQTPGS